MAGLNILYGVVGEGMGHATRSSVVIEHLLAAGHKVRAVASGRAYTYLKDRFPEVDQIHGLHIVYEENRVQRRETVLSNLADAPENIATNMRAYFELVGDFTPNMVISDFDSFAWMFARNHGLPVLSIDNMQIINRCRHEPLPPGHDGDFQMTRALVKSKLPGCEHYFITTFFYPPVRKRRTTLVPSILRRAILEAEQRDGEHILVYQTSPSFQALLPALQRMPGQRFKVYGFNRDEDLGNVTLHRFSDDGFIQDLATCRAVIANGGFTLLSEAVYLHKPILSVPVGRQFEQVLNGWYIYKMGYGETWETLDEDLIAHFLGNIPRYQSNLASYGQDGNRLLFENLDEAIGLLAAGHTLPDTFDEPLDEDDSIMGR